jgi:hypothetical protein
MTRLTIYLAATAALAGLAAPAAAQTYPYPQPYPQPQQYPQQYPPQYSPQYSQQYPQSGYAYPGQPGYGSSPVAQIINQLLGNRYNVSDRNAVERCASAAMVQASSQYGQRYNNGRYGQGYAQPYGYNSQMRVTAITEVQRRNNGLRVSGLLSSGYGAYGNQAYADPRYGVRADLSFRCNVDYRGAVTNVRIRRT